MDASVTIKSEVLEAISYETENCEIKFSLSPDNPPQVVKSYANEENMDASLTVKSEVLEAISDETENCKIQFSLSPDNPPQVVKSYANEENVDASVTIKSEVLEAISGETENCEIKFSSPPDISPQVVKASAIKKSCNIKTSGKLPKIAVSCKSKSEISVKEKDFVHKEPNPKVPIPRCKSIRSGDKCKTALRNIISFNEPDIFPKLLPCGVCSESFANREELLKHLQGHTGKIPIKKLEKKSPTVVKIFSCKICEKTFASSVDFRYHRCMRVNFSNVLVKCQYCFEDIKTCGLAAHMRQVHADQDPYRCEQCGASLRSRTALKKHVYAHHGNSLFCEVCKKRFRNPENLKTHVRIHDEKSSHTTENNITKSPGPAGLLPEKCVEKLVLPIDPPQRIPEPHKNPSTCRICSKVFTQEATFQQHLQTHSAHNFVCCKKCDLRFQDGADYRAHSKLHFNLFPCRVCGKMFEKSELQDHMKVHAGLLADTRKRQFRAVVKIIRCEYCEKIFGFERDLKKHHDSVHKDIKLFACELCPCGFTRKYDLISHIKIRHLKEKRKHLDLNVPCEACGKHFTNKTSLRRHLKIHTDERRYTCDFCKKRFLTFHDRQIHLRVHTHENPFTCDTCQKSFRYNSTFRDHIKTHSKEKLSCNLCKRVFTRKFHWLNHIKKCSESNAQLSDSREMQPDMNKVVLF
ncbi:zinc finger protein 26-like [Uloborus diversus]|uniref:zinc finger protein 26-like n=1 Tax=Uloborus diversus TaxID=327109 RepID=UPI00240A8B5A|nr:zinc finger protein 26-like [Uloborus diversus]